MKPRFLPYTLKTLWRHRMRTMLTVAGSAVALFVFCFIGAVQEGMQQLQHSRASQRSLVVFQANKFCPATSHLPQDYENSIADLKEVRDVVPTQVFTNNCRASLDVIVFHGVPPLQLRTTRNFSLISGTWPDFEDHQDAALVGRAVALRRGLKTGGSFSLGDLTVTVAGIFTSPDATEENYIYSHLDFLQRSKSLNLVGTVTQFEVLLNAEADPTTTCEAIDMLFRGASVETATRPKGVFQAASLGDLAQLVELAHYLGYACVGLVLALVATTTVMSVQDRVAEHALLLTLGFTGPRIFTLVLLESVLLSLAGGGLGVSVASLVLLLSNLSVGAEAVAVGFTPSISLAATSMAVSLVAGAAAGIVPAWNAAHVDIVPSLRDG